MRTVYEDIYSSMGTVLRCYLLGSIVNCILTFSFFLATLLSLSHTHIKEMLSDEMRKMKQEHERKSERERPHMNFNL